MKKNKKDIKKAKKNLGKDEYGYDFVANLAHFTNIDEQRKMAKKMENISLDNEYPGKS